MSAEKKIKKHVAIIHAYSLMTSLQRKIVNALLYEVKNGAVKHLNQKNSVAVERQISLSRLKELVNFNSNNTDYLKNSIDGLASLKIEWNLLRDKIPLDISFLNLRVLHGSPTFYNDGTFNFSFHKVMLELADNPSVYGTIDIQLQSKFESKYSHALYENSTRFLNLQKRNKVINIETFRKLLGVPENKHLDVRDLKRAVIKPAIEEVNDLTNFVVSIEPNKRGRNVDGFELFVNSKVTSNVIDKYAITLENEKLHKKIRDAFGTAIKSNILDDVVEKYSEEYILEKIDYTKNHIKKDEFGLYPIPYFIKALQDDYKSNKDQKYHDSHEPKLDEIREWEHEFNSLRAELNHFRRLLTYAPGENAYTTAILEYEKKLEAHFLKRETIKENAE